MFVCLLPNSSETANPKELLLRDDSPVGRNGFRLKAIDLTFSGKLAMQMEASSRYSNFSGVL